MNPASRISIVVLTYNRRAEIQRTLERLLGNGESTESTAVGAAGGTANEAAQICVVDNGSRDGTAEVIARRFPTLRLIRLAENLGAAGRNRGVQAARTPYVAFCDDDTWWAPGSLTRATELLDRHPELAALTARVLVGPEDREDPTCRLMAASPIPAIPGIDGIAIVAGLLAGACVIRREAFLAAGGYEPRLFLGGEERLLALDLMAAGWHLGYAPALVVHHHPSSLRDSAARRHLLLRNALWCAWLRRPLPGALRESLARLRAVAGEPRLLAAVFDALQGLPWVLRRRRVIPGQVEARLQLVERQQA